MNHYKQPSRTSGFSLNSFVYFAKYKFLNKFTLDKHTANLTLYIDFFPNNRYSKIIKVKVYNYEYV